MKILFMCVANSARSQMAEGLCKQIFSEAEIESAGSEPGKLNSYAVAVMKEIGVDISEKFSKGVDQLSPRFLVELNYVITLCAEEVCPTVFAPQAKRLQWPFKDPANKESLDESSMLARFREARDLIQQRLKDFKTEIEGQ